MNYYNLPLEECLKELNSNNDGLSSDEVQVRLEKYGKNELLEEEQEKWWKLLLSQFNNLLIYILMLSAIISIFLGKTVEPIAIIVIVILAGITGFVQEFQAGKAIAALKKMASPTARVIREKTEIEIASSDLVPGDIIILNSGDKVPADARLLAANRLRTDEASLTGESHSISKHTDAIFGDSIPLGDRKNSAYMGTSVVLGRATAVVTATGMQTEFGKIANMLNKTEARKTPLQLNLDKLGKQLGIFSIVLATLVSIFDFLRGSPLDEVFIWGVALAVAIIPEALPAVVTITLALGVKRMVRRKALIRKLPAVETLGATNIICSDKTGTLTQDEMTIRQIFVNGNNFFVSGSGYKPEGKFSINDKIISPYDYPELIDLLVKGSLCNDALLKFEDNEWKLLGDPTEGSIIVVARKAGIDTDSIRASHKRVFEIPFSSETKRMTTVNQFEHSNLSIAKGAPEEILNACSHILIDGNKVLIDNQHRTNILDEAKAFAEKALRVIAMAERILDVDNFDEVEQNLTFLGIVGMIDPPREEVKEAIKTCERAGIKPIMITGDHKITAMAVAKELGIIKNGIAISGTELNNLSDAEFDKIVDNAEVYARIAPEHKMKIVEALIQKGNVVAMTGDGVNDAPSLKRADIGVAMGITGTDVSKEAADMILTDDNFASIVAAVEEGRSIFENIRKYLVYLLSGNMGTVIGLVGALLMGFATPLLAVHILFINFIMDGIMAITLGVEPPEKGIMQRRPRPQNEGILNKLSIHYIASIGVWIGLICLAMFIFFAGAAPSAEASRSEDYPMTIFYVTLIMARIFNAFSTRSINDSFFRYGILGNPTMIIGIALTLLLTLLTINWTLMHNVFSTISLSLNDWLYVTIAGSTVLIYSEIHKLIVRKFVKQY